jgi:hypothetical protein
MMVVVVVTKRVDGIGHHGHVRPKVCGHLEEKKVMIAIEMTMTIADVTIIVIHQCVHLYRRVKAALTMKLVNQAHD